MAALAALADVMITADAVPSSGFLFSFAAVVAVVLTFANNHQKTIWKCPSPAPAADNNIPDCV